MKAFRSIPSYPKRLENQRQTNWIFPTRNVFLTLYFVEFGKQEMYSVFFVVVREMVLFK